MNFDLSTILLTHLLNTYTISLILGIIAVALIITVIISKKSNIFLPRPYDTRLVDYLPFEKLLNDKNTILCSNG